MSQQKFIESNVEKTLMTEGFTQYTAKNCARQAARNWARSTGAKGSMMNQLLVQARKQAAQMKKAGL